MNPKRKTAIIVGVLFIFATVMSIASARSLSLAEKVVPALPTLHKDLLRDEEVVYPEPKLGIVAQDLFEVPFRRLPLLLDAVARAHLF